MVRVLEIREQLAERAKAYASGTATIADLCATAIIYAQQIYRNRKSRDRNKWRKAQTKRLGSG